MTKENVHGSIEEGYKEGEEETDVSRCGLPT